MTVVTCGSIPASRSTSTAELRRRPGRPQLVVDRLPQGAETHQGMGRGQLNDHQRPRVRRQGSDEGDHVVDVVEDVGADDDVTHRHLVGEVGPRPFVRRDGNPTIAR